MRKLLIILSIAGFTITAYAQKTVPCPNCHGACKVTERCGACHNGAVFCNSCSGSGEKRERCSGCNGGYTERTVSKVCPGCNGRKSFSQNQPTDCSCRGGKRPVQNGNSVSYVDCTRCKGTGKLDNYVSIACRSCGGMGYSGTETIREKHSCNNGYISSTCSICSGKGAYVCSKCQGYANIQVDCRRCSGYGKIYVAG